MSISEDRRSLTTDGRFASLYEEHYAAVLAHCRRRTEVDRADDVAAETFLVVCRKIDEVPSGDQTRPWLFGIAYRALLHQWRTHGRLRRLEGRLASIDLHWSSEPEHYIVARHDSTQVLAAASRLRPIDQEMLRLSLWEELTHAEISVVLGLQPPAVRKRLSRALNNLAREFSRLDGTTPSGASREGTA
jgi:RNA polymerase sigma-70 factor (ECF subfamily)